ncbi:MAG: hypothetical protein AAGJ10_05760 [Bacteroidota bacterium]
MMVVRYYRLLLLLAMLLTFFAFASLVCAHPVTAGPDAVGSDARAPADVTASPPMR